MPLPRVARGCRVLLGLLRVSFQLARPSVVSAAPSGRTRKAFYETAARYAIEDATVVFVAWWSDPLLQHSHVALRVTCPGFALRQRGSWH